ncbi:Outer membrane protein Imp, required for envelope biogenesis / Organic solvent tolerance protein precursor [hydrothermal vent metagenome]|uniref:Outer membrane protein Imp, required for envelope biogenesis / Organic solvent tolerance protein n=1 Tax=hydrothermal vent metagenome TaxID=652676 RepID=A0A3B0TD54_9ZZZZ
MRLRRKDSISLRLSLAIAGAVLLLSVSVTAFAQSPDQSLNPALGPFFGIDDNASTRDKAQRFLPAGFFDNFPSAQKESIALEADSLVYDADANTIIARGNVRLGYQDYRAFADRAVYDRTSGDVTLIGNAAVRSPDKTIYQGTRITVKGDFKQAFVDALIMQTPDGALVTADKAEYRDKISSILQNGSYAPCGTCIDKNGNKIGWRVRAVKIIINRKEQTMYMEQPRLELVGAPMASLPFLWLPTPENPIMQGYRPPRFAVSDKFGYGVGLPYMFSIGANTDFLFSPMLMSRQGLLLDGTLTQRFGQDQGAGQIKGQASVRAAGLYQLDKSAFAGQVGEKDWRGAIQISGAFTPAKDWNAGWSYLAFSDPAFIPDYQLAGFDTINDIYVQKFSANSFFDARVQEFKVLGNVSGAVQDQQGSTLPLVRLNRVEQLANDFGQVAINANLIGVNRKLDHSATIGAVPYLYGYQGNKYHAMVEASWSKQSIVPGGLVMTPYLGGRIDISGYDGASALLPASTLFSATPIAALDIRFPLIALDGDNSYLFEPVAQLVYRANSTSMVGINNDNAQGFVFEDSNLFSFNRFSGSDRQETGLRLNVGGQVMANFADNSWLRLIGGQSYQLAGINAFSVVDHAQTGNGSGLETTASYIVAGAAASFGGGVEAGAKIEVDPVKVQLVRAAAAAKLDMSDFTLSANYYFLAAQPARGAVSDTNTISASLTVPLADYWKATGSVSWNLVARNWSQLAIGAQYDDKFLEYGAQYKAIQNISSLAVDHRFTVNFKLKGPSGN